MMPGVVIVVLSWNQCALTLECLESLLHSDPVQPPLRIILVDNASTDNTVQCVEERFPSVAIIESRDNLGYAGGNNLGIRRALADGAQYVCLLNNDVTVSPGFLAPLLRALVQKPDIGAVTPLVLEPEGASWVGVLGSLVDRRTGLVRHIRGAGTDERIREGTPFFVDATHGAATLTRRDVLEDVGLLDEEYYLYYEETDWCLRVQRAGYRVVAVPGSLVWHRGSASIGRTSPAIDYYMNRNAFRFVARNWAGRDRIRVLLGMAKRQALAIGAQAVKHSSTEGSANRMARLRAMHDALLGRWGPLTSGLPTRSPGKH